MNLTQLSLRAVFQRFPLRSGSIAHVRRRLFRVSVLSAGFVLSTALAASAQNVDSPFIPLPPLEADQVTSKVVPPSDSDDIFRLPEIHPQPVLKSRAASQAATQSRQSVSPALAVFEDNAGSGTQRDVVQKVEFVPAPPVEFDAAQSSLALPSALPLTGGPVFDQPLPVGVLADPGLEPDSISDTELAQAEPAESGIAPAPQFVLDIKDVQKLLTRARLELAAGDVELAHAFAEAAAEVPIPFELFEKQAEQVLSEIEQVTSQANALNNVVFTQDSPEAAATVEEPATDGPVGFGRLKTSDELRANPLAFRALSRGSLSVSPSTIDVSGVAQRIPRSMHADNAQTKPRLQHMIGFSREWAPMQYSWDAPAHKHNPLYFEDPQLERYGNEFPLQPVVSGTKFFLTIPTLPYQMAIEDNGICHEVYDLGYDRPGNCVPYTLQTLPFSWTGALTEGGLITAMIFAL